jgi:hypothetical protein
VRPISLGDSCRIVTLGLAEHDDLLPHIGEATTDSAVREEPVPLLYEQERITR